ncbi:MAG: ATP-binding cassette domain-containing protein [Lentisphaeria bacterium]|nr:ATP-binding cassette domain-containing protein [Lentisphaeria bacterium]
MIKIKNLCRRWGDFALQNVDLEVTGSEYLVILGPCGSGKTLLLETVAGLYTPSAGRVIVNGRDVTKLCPEQRRVGLVYQQYALFPHLSVRANIEYGLKYLKLPKEKRRERSDEMIDLLGIGDIAGRKTPDSLSGGEAQKVALARALAIHPEVLLLDEPLSSLDQQARERVIDILPEINRRLRIPVIHVTHHYSEATALADRVVIMQNGRVVQTGTVNDVFRHPENTFVADFLGIDDIGSGTVEPVGDGRARLAFEGMQFEVPNPSGITGAAALCIRPEDAIVHAGDPGRTNVVRVRVRELRDMGLTVRLQLSKGDWQAIAVLPEALFSELGLNVGGDAWLELPATKLHLMKQEAETHHAH